MRLVLIASAVLFASASAAAQTSPVSLVVKSALEPQVGADVRLGGRLSARALAAFATDFEDGTYIVNVAALYRLGGPGPLTTRVGLSTTVVDFDDLGLFGVLFGVEYALSERFGVFGEAALDADFGDGLGIVRTSNNSGVGVRLRL